MDLDLKTRLIMGVFLLVLSLHLLVLVRIERFTPFWSMFVTGHIQQMRHSSLTCVICDVT